MKAYMLEVVAVACETLIATLGKILDNWKLGENDRDVLADFRDRAGSIRDWVKNMQQNLEK